MMPQAVVANPLAHAALPRLSSHYAAGHLPSFRGLLAKLLAIGGVLGTAGIVVAVLGGRALVTLVYSPEYAQHTEVFVTLMVSLGFAFLVCFLIRSGCLCGTQARAFCTSSAATDCGTSA